MIKRIPSFEAFWPHYLSEHSNALSRRLHFVGTTGFLGAVAASAVANPIGFPLAMVGFGLIARDAMKREATKAPFGHVAAMVVLPAIASPVFLGGVVCAYAFAWIGHFVVEKNRPATFSYPVWSLASDFRMYGHMLRGKLWSGDPLQELNLQAPADLTPATEARAA